MITNRGFYLKIWARNFVNLPEVGVHLLYKPLKILEHKSRDKSLNRLVGLEALYSHNYEKKY